MKLIFCKKCQDVVRLREVERICSCGASSGYYVDEVNAVIFGDCVPVGVINDDFARAVREQPDGGYGKRFDAFVIPKQCDTIKHLARASAKC